MTASSSLPPRNSYFYLFMTFRDLCLHKHENRGARLEKKLVTWEVQTYTRAHALAYAETRVNTLSEQSLFTWTTNAASGGAHRQEKGGVYKSIKWNKHVCRHAESVSRVSGTTQVIVAPTMRSSGSLLTYKKTTRSIISCLQLTENAAVKQQQQQQQQQQEFWERKGKAVKASERLRENLKCFFWACVKHRSAQKSYKARVHIPFG